MDTELMTKQNNNANSNEMKINELQEKIYNLENFCLVQK